MIRLGVAGAAGRTGSRVVELARADGRFHVVPLDVRRSDAASSPAPSAEWNEPLDVLVDFTSPSGTLYHLERCEKHRVPMVVGATGHGEDALARLRKASAVIAILKSANFSLGVNVLLETVGRLAAALGESFDIEIVETHHRHKQDAPSGTALAVAEEVGRALNRSLDAALVHGRRGRTGERRPGEIGIHAVRMGEIVGQHEVLFSGPGETITIRHAAHSRDAFAVGALRAATWMIGQPPGWYSFRDVLRDSPVSP